MKAMATEPFIGNMRGPVDLLPLNAPSFKLGFCSPPRRRTCVRADSAKNRSSGS
jgi:hypothetical protein